MTDFSYLDKKYFIDRTVYNCPFCNRNNVPYSIVNTFSFAWTESKRCYGFIAKCDYCENKSLHLSYEDLIDNYYSRIKEHISDIDSKIFYSVPTSYFVLDSRIPSAIRELISEAEGSLKMNFLTGASACMRKAIYELLVYEKIKGDHYQDKIKLLKSKHANVDADLFDILSHIQDMTSDKVHEQSWDKWESKYLRYIIETLKAILYDIYVLPDIKNGRTNFIKQLKEEVSKKSEKKENSDDPRGTRKA